jgi:peroxiredoxin
VRSHKAEFDRRGVAIAIVSFAEPAKLLHYQEEQRWPFTMLADPQRVAYRMFGLKRLSWFHVFSAATLKLYVKLLREGWKRKRDYGGGDIYQGGGDFLLDAQGNILFAHRSRDPADRPSPEKLLRELDRLEPGNDAVR